MKKSLLILTSLLLTVSLPLFAISCDKAGTEADDAEKTADGAEVTDTVSEENADASSVGDEQTADEEEEDIPGMIHVGVSIAGYDGTENSVYDILTVPEHATAADCFAQECALRDIPIEGLEDGFVTAIGGRENEGSMAWIFTINGIVAMDGVKDYYVVPDDDIAFTYQDWTSLFE